MKKLVFTVTILVDEPSDVEIESFVEEIDDSIDVTWGQDAEAVFISLEEEELNLE